MYLCKELEMSQIKPLIKNQNKTRSSTISYVIALLPLLSACGNGGSSNGGKNTPLVNSQLILTAPSIVPSLPGKIGNNYLVVSNNSSSVINGISYSLGNQVGAGSKLVLDSQSIANCSNIMAYTNCYIKLSVAESAIAGAAIVTASANNVNTNAAIGIQQVPFNNVANANGVGLYFYNKVQYSQGGFPYILVTAVIQSSKLGNINTVQLVNESGTLISGQFVVSNNSGPDKSILQQGDVVEIALPIPQGVGLSQNMKVQTSYQTVSTNNIDKLSHANHSLNGSTTNTSTGTTIYSFTTQGSNINLQLIPNQIFLTATNPSQSGFLYNIGDMTASQIQTGSSSQNVNITNTTTTLNKQEAVAINYQLQNTASTPTINSVFATAQNPSGQVQVNFGQTGQNVSPNVTPTPSPTPTPTPSPSPAPGPSPGPSPSPIPALTITSNQNPQAGGVCSTLTATVPSPVGPATLITFAAPSDPNNYGFAASAPYPSSATCTIAQGGSSCSTSVGNNLCAATGATAGTPITVVGGASGYTTGSVNLTIAAKTPSLAVTTSQNPIAGGSCDVVTATANQAVVSDTPVTFTIPSSSNYGFGSPKAVSYAQTTATCTISAAGTSCSTTTGSNLCAASTAIATTPIIITANASGLTNGESTVAINAFYAYVANWTPGVFQCTASDIDGSLTCLTASTRPDPSLNALSTIIDPTGSYLYVLTSDTSSPGSYITCALDSNGTYDNTKCVTKTFPPYGNLAFAPTGDNWFAYLAGIPASNSGNNPNYCTVFQESSLFCNTASTSPTIGSKGVTSIVVNGSSLVYLSGTNNTDSPYNAKISVCDVSSSAGYSNCRAAYGSMSITNPTSLSAVQIGADYYVYVLDYSNQVAYCKIETSGVNKGKFTDVTGCNYIDSTTLDITGVQSITAVNLNGKPYLYAPYSNGNLIYICPLNSDGSVSDSACSIYSPNSSVIPSFIPNGISFGSF